jgi:hypothetical protein
LLQHGGNLGKDRHNSLSPRTTLLLSNTADGAINETHRAVKDKAAAGMLPA